MVLFLNYLPLIVSIIFAFIGMKLWEKHTGNRKLQVRKALYVVAGWLGTLLLLTALTNTYFPKGTPARMVVPVFEEPAEDVVIQDRLRGPAKTAEQSEADFQQMVDWRQAKADREAAKAKREQATAEK